MMAEMKIEGRRMGQTRTDHGGRRGEKRGAALGRIGMWVTGRGDVRRDIRGE